MNVTLTSSLVSEVAAEKLAEFQLNTRNRINEIYFQQRRLSGVRYNWPFTRKDTESLGEFSHRTRFESNSVYSLQQDLERKEKILQEIIEICEKFPEVTLTHEEIKLIYL